MQLYKEIKNPSPDDVIRAMSQSAYMAALVETPEAVAQGIGDAQHLHAFYNTLDEAAAIRHEKMRKVPEGTFSSRLLEDGSTNEYPEDVLKARERRDEQANRRINAQVERWWIKRGLNHATEYPHRKIITAALQWINGHAFLETPIAQEIQAADERAEKSTIRPALGEPSALLVSWLSSYFLITHKEIYTYLLNCWKHNPTKPDIDRLYVDDITEWHPEIKKPLFKLFNDFFAYHMAHLDETTDNPYFYFDGTFGGFVDNNLPDSIFYPEITLDTYRRFYPDDWPSKNCPED